MLSEHEEQVALIKWLKLNKYFFFAVPNGSKRDMVTARKLKDEGVKSGVADLVVFLKNKILFLELKRSPKKLKSGKLSYSNSKISLEQKAFLMKLEDYDYAVGRVGFGWKNCVEIIEELDK